jgi:outer membrane protein TolC
MDDEMAAGIVPLSTTQQRKAQLLDKRKQLNDLKEGLMMAEIELKTLIDYPLDQPIKLDLEGRDWLSVGSIPQIKGDILQLEETAFQNRPELREEILNKRISSRDIKLSVLETIPGFSIFTGYNKDTNQYLAEPEWVDWTLSLTQSITKLITLPARHQRAVDVDELSDKRRHALVAAIITQVHVSKARYEFLSNSYNEMHEADLNNQQILKRAEDFSKVGMMAGPDLLNAEIDASVSHINKAFAYANVQDSYARFINTMGVDIWDADNAGLTVPDFAQQLKKNLANEEIFVASTETTEAGG